MTLATAKFNRLLAYVSFNHRETVNEYSKELLFLQVSSCLSLYSALSLFLFNTITKRASPYSCHALVLVFCVFFIHLVRPGCDMGFVCGVFCLGVFVRYWLCGFVGVSSIVYGCLEWFSIRGRCLSLSLIGTHI